MQHRTLKAILCLLAFLSAGHAGIAQSPALQWVKGGGGQSPSNGLDDVEEAKLISADHHGHLYSFGCINTGNVAVDTFHRAATYNNQSDLLLCCWGCDGSLRWARTMGDQYYDRPYGIATDSSGNVYVSGTGGGSGFNTFQVNDSLISAAVAKDLFFVAKFDSTGVLQWLRFPGTSDIYTQNRVWKLEIDSSGKLAVFAQLIHYPGNDFAGFPILPGNERNLYRFRMDTETGSVTDLIRIQGITTTGNYGSFFANAIDTDPDGNSYMYLEPIQGDTIVVNGVSATMDPYVIETLLASFDDAGNTRWVKKVSYTTVTGTGEFLPQLMVTSLVHNSGHLYVSGAMFKSPVFDGTTLVNPNAIDDSNRYCGALVSLSSSTGDLSSYSTIRTFGLPGGSGLLLLDLAKTSNNELAMTGELTCGAILNANDTLMPVAGSTCGGAPVILYDLATMQMRGGNLPTFNTFSSGYSVSADHSGNVYVGGRFSGPGYLSPTNGPNLNFNGGDFDFFVARYGDADGCEYDATSVASTEVGSTLRIYPNPAGDFVILESRSAGPLDYAVYDFGGRLVLAGNCDSGNRHMDVSALGGGVYLLRGRMADGTQVSMKLSIVR